MNYPTRYIGLFAAWLALTAATIGDPAASKSAQALEHYERGEFPQALQLYRDAQLERPDAPELNFNVGSALFKSGDYESALREFSQAARDARDPLKANSHYNMGNVLYQQQQYQQAVEAYRQALEIDSDDVDAKANLELALKQLEQQQQDQQQDQQDQQQDQQDQQDQQQDQQDQQQDQQDQQQDQQDQQDQQHDQQGISQAEAEQLLDALKEREMDAQKRRYRATGQSRGKDW